MLSRDVIAEMLPQYSRSTRDAYIQRIARRRLVVARPKLPVVAAAELFS